MNISIIKDSSSELFVENSFTYGLFNDKYPLHLIRLNDVSENFRFLKIEFLTILQMILIMKMGLQKINISNFGIKVL